MTESSFIRKTEHDEKLIRRAVPVLLFIYVFSLIIDSGFKFITPSIQHSLDLSLETASLQVTLAGIVLAIGIVVYSALADTFSMRKLVSVAISLVIIGSLLGLVFSKVWAAVLAGRIIQTTGIAAAETLYVIYVSKKFAGSEQKKYLGYSTAAFQAAGLFGVVAAGFLSTKVHWMWMFAVPLLMLLTVPLLKRIPDTVDEVDEAEKTHLDAFGLLLVAIIAAGLIMFMQAFNWIWVLPVVVALGVFIWHISVHDDAIVDPAFFTNLPYLMALGTIFLMYIAYMGFVYFVFPVALPEVHGFDPLNVAFLMIPGYIAGIIVGVLSGKISEKMNSRTQVLLAITLSFIAVACSAFFIRSAVVVLVFALGLYIASDSLMYAPLISTAISRIPNHKTGIAIGFYNLVINIAFPVGAAITAKLMAAEPTFLSGLAAGSGGMGQHHITVLWILSGFCLAAFIFYWTASRIVEKSDPELIDSKSVEG